MGRVYLWFYHICLNNMRCYFLKTKINPVTNLKNPFKIHDSRSFAGELFRFIN